MGNRNKYLPRYEQITSLQKLANEYDGSYPLYDARENEGFSIELEKFSVHASYEKYCFYSIFNPLGTPSERKKTKICDVNELQIAFWNLSEKFKYERPCLSCDRVSLSLSTIKGYGEFIIRHNLTAKEIKLHKFVHDSCDFFWPKWEKIPVRIERVKGKL